MGIQNKKPLLAVSVLVALAASLAMAGDASAQIEEFRFQWAPCPTEGPDGERMAEAVQYEVWLQLGSAPEERIAMVLGDTTYTLVTEPGVAHRIRVCGYDAQGRQSPMSEWSEPVYYEAGRSGLLVPERASLRPNYPNPFNPETGIIYGVPLSLPSDAPLRLEILDLRGQRVRTFQVSSAPGWHEVQWNGTDDHGRMQPTGIYFSRFICGDVVSVQKMTMVK